MLPFIISDGTMFPHLLNFIGRPFKILLTMRCPILVTLLFCVLLPLCSRSQALSDYYKLDDSDIHIEGIASGLNAGSFFLGGVNTGDLYELRNKRVTRYPVPRDWPHWSLMGMKTDSSRSLLFISRAALPQSPDTANKYHASDVVVFDLLSKSFIKRIPMTDTGRSILFNDIAIASDGHLLVSDGGRPGGIYELNYNDGHFRSLNTKGIRSPQGVVAIDSMIYIASYTQGLFQYDTRRDTAVPVAVGGLINELLYMDGLTSYKHKLIAICNGDQRSVINIDLNNFQGSVIQNLQMPEYNEPTLGVVQSGALYFVSNSQWESYALPKQKKPVRKPAIISRVVLD
jgi:hypothetical protein